MRSLFKALFLLLMSVSIACANSTSHLVRATATNPGTLDPHQASIYNEFVILGDLYEGLTTYSARGQIVAGVAQSWQQTTDGKVWDFKLDPDARWSDDRPVTAEDFVTGFRRLLAPDTNAPYASLFHPIVGAEPFDSATFGVKALGSDRVQITLETPIPYFPELLALPAALPIRADLLAKKNTTAFIGDDLVSNGAYTLAEARFNARFALRKNMSFRDAGNVMLDQVTYAVVEDPNTCIRRFEAGDVHACDYLPTRLAASMTDRLGDALAAPPSAGVFYLVMNTQRPPLDNPDVRRALNLLIDRSTVSEDVLNGLMPAAHAIVPPGVDNYAADRPVLAFNTTTLFERESTAQELLRNAGITPEMPIELELAHSKLEDEKPIALYIADRWARHGVDVRFSQRELAVHYEDLSSDRTYDLALAGWQADFLDPVAFLELFRNGSPYDYANLSSAKVDDLLDAASLESDIADRARLLAEAEQLVLDSDTYLPLIYLAIPRLVSERVEGWKDNPRAINLSRFLQLRE